MGKKGFAFLVLVCLLVIGMPDALANDAEQQINSDLSEEHKEAIENRADTAQRLSLDEKEIAAEERCGNRLAKISRFAIPRRFAENDCGGATGFQNTLCAAL